MATKVFLSWSGDLSRKLAEAFSDWLPNVLQNTETFFSSADIEKGTEWLATIKQELADSTMGVLFITPTNTDAPWLLFEAGVMANRFEDNAKVCPILFNLKRTNFTGPLSHYQNTINSREDILKLIHSVNNSADTSDTIKPDILERAYDRWWDDLAKAFSKILENHTEEATPKPERSDREVMSEILGIVRNMERNKDKVYFADLQLNTGDSGHDYFINPPKKRFADLCRDYIYQVNPSPNLLSRFDFKVTVVLEGKGGSIKQVLNQLAQAGYQTHTVFQDSHVHVAEISGQLNSKDELPDLLDRLAKKHHLDVEINSDSCSFTTNS